MRTYQGKVRLRGWHGCLAIAIFVTNVSGCSFLTPRYNRPAAPVPETYPESSLSEEKEQLAADATIGWQDYFADESLRSLIDQALKNNRDLQSAVYRVEEAHALYRVQRSELFPTIFAAADASRTRVPADLSDFGQRETIKVYDVLISTSSWEVDFWGRIRGLTQVSLENYLASDAGRRAVTVSLIANVADSFLRVREIDERIILSRQAIESRRESFRIFSRRLEQGQISSLDVVQVETLLKQAELLGAQLEQERAGETHLLAFLVGSPVNIQRSEAFNDEAVMHPLRPGLPSELLVNRPDIIAAEHQLRATHANIGAARAAFFPAVQLIGDAGTASAELDNLFGSDSKTWQYGANVSLPVFDAGRNRNSLNAANAGRGVAIAEYEKTVQTAFREVADALSAQKWLAEQVRILGENLAVQERRNKLAQERYSAGASTFIEVLDAQRDLLTAQQQFVQTRRALLSSRVRLYSALGGGASANVQTGTTMSNQGPMKGN